MEDGNIENGPASRPEWEHLEEWLRGQVQGLIQELLEQEVTEFLGRARSVRRSESDNDAALGDFDAVRGLDPDNASALRGRGVALGRSLELDPGNAETLTAGLSPTPVWSNTGWR